MKEELWVEINMSEYDEYLYDDALEFSNNQFNIISSKHNSKKIINDKKCIKIKNQKLQIAFIYRYTDEWYIIGLDGKSYKCDQFDGLLDCLNNIL